MQKIPVTKFVMINASMQTLISSLDAWQTASNEIYGNQKRLS